MPKSTISKRRRDQMAYTMASRSQRHVHEDGHDQSRFHQHEGDDQNHLR